MKIRLKASTILNALSISKKVITLIKILKSKNLVAILVIIILMTDKKEESEKISYI